MTMPEAGIEVQAGLQVALGNLAQAVAREQAHRARMAACIQQVPLAGGLPGSGTLDQPDQLQAKTGYYWGIRRLVASGWTAGSVTIYKNAAGGEILVTYPGPATFTFGRGEMLLNPGDRMVVVAAGITGSVQVNGAADCFESWYLPYYIG